MLLPEAPHRERDPDRDGRIGGGHRPVEDGPDVVVLELEPVDPAPLCRTRQLPRRPFHERHVPLAMAVADQVSLAVGLESFRGVFTDRVEQPEARLAVGCLLDLDQALVDERHQAVEDLHADLGRWPADRFGRGEVAATGEDRQPVEQSLAAIVEQVVAPGDRSAQRLLTLGQVACPGRQDVQLVIEPDEDRVGAEQLDPGGGQLDRERHAVEPCADRGDGRRVLVGDAETRADRDGTLDEQADRGVLAERGQVDGPRSATEVHPLQAGLLARVGRRRQARDLVLLLARDVQHGAAGDDRLDLGCRPQQVGDDRGGRDDLFEVVEDQQQTLVPEPVGQRLVDRSRGALRDAEGAGDPRRDEHGIADGLEGNEEDAVREVVRCPGRQLERQPRLAGPARAGERQQPGRGEQAGRRLELGVAPDERRQLGRQVVRPGIERSEGREVGRQAGGDDLDDPHRRAQVLEPVVAEVPQRDPVDRAIDELVPDQAGGEDLAAVGQARDPRRPVDAQPDKALPGLFGTAGVDAHPDLDRRVIGPGLGRQRALRRDGGFDGVRGFVERDEERVAFGALLDASVGLARRPQDRAMALAQLGVAIPPDGLLEPSRALDVAEQEGECPAHRRSGLGHPWSTRTAVSAGRLRSGRAGGRPARAGSRWQRLAPRGGRSRSPSSGGRGRSSARRR